MIFRTKFFFFSKTVAVRALKQDNRSDVENNTESRIKNIMYLHSGVEIVGIKS